MGDSVPMEADEVGRLAERVLCLPVFLNAEYHPVGCSAVKKRALRAVSRATRAAVNASTSSLHVWSDVSLDKADANELATIMANSMTNVTRVEIRQFENYLNFHARLLSLPVFWQRLRKIDLRIHFHKLTGYPTGADYPGALKALKESFVSWCAMPLPTLQSFRYHDDGCKVYMPLMSKAPWVSQLKDLETGGCKSILPLINACSNLTRLKLQIREEGPNSRHSVGCLDKECGRAVAQLKHLRYIAVDTEYNHEGVEELIKAEWKDVEYLDFSRPTVYIQEEELKLLLTQAQWQFKAGGHLDLTLQEDLTADTFKSLGAVPWFRQLGLLDLGGCWLDNHFVKALVQTPMPYLTHLCLESNDISLEGLRALAKATGGNLTNLNHFTLPWEYVEAKGAFQVFAKGEWASVKRFDLMSMEYPPDPPYEAVAGLADWSSRDYENESGRYCNDFQVAMLRAEPEKWKGWKFEAEYGFLKCSALDPSPSHLAVE